MASLGIQLDVNKGDDAVTKSSARARSSKAIEVFDIPPSGIIPSKKTYSEILLPMSVNDQNYIVPLLKKYGTTNFKALERDIKLNNMQCTENKLSNMVRKFFSLTDEQRVVTLDT
jgi:hypothetical protein